MLATETSKMALTICLKSSRHFVKKVKNWRSSDHPIMFKVCQPVVQILQMIFPTSDVSISKGNIKPLSEQQLFTLILRSSSTMFFAAVANI